MLLAMKATVTTNVVEAVPLEQLHDVLHHRPLANCSIGLGWFDVSGRRRVPSPPAMITAFMPTPPSLT